MKHNALAHDAHDSVAVAVRDIEKGEDAVIANLADDNTTTIKALDAVPLGHKIALTDIRNGEKVIKYGEEIGIAKADIAKGQWVHTQNVRSQRWALSTR